MSTPADAGLREIVALYLGKTSAALHLAQMDGPGVGWVPRSMAVMAPDALEAAEQERKLGGRAVLKLGVPAWKLDDLGWSGAGAGQGRLFG